MKELLNQSRIGRHRPQIRMCLRAIALLGAGLSGHGLAVDGPHQPPMVEPAPLDPQEARERDHAAIQGKWKLVAMQAAGNPAPAQVIGVMKYEFKGDKLLITPAEPGQPDYSFKLDPVAQPIATFDMTAVGGDKAGEVGQGIYELKGDKLRICLDKKHRPARFEATAEDGFGRVLIELERE